MAEQKPTEKAPLPPGRLQTGDVHIDVTQIVAQAPLWQRKGPKPAGTEPK